LAKEKTPNLSWFRFISPGKPDGSDLLGWLGVVLPLEGHLVVGIDTNLADRKNSQVADNDNVEYHFMVNGRNT
jgi:hypothetical protein